MNSLLGDKPNSASGEESWRDVLDNDDMELLELLAELSGMHIIQERIYFYHKLTHLKFHSAI